MKGNFEFSPKLFTLFYFIIFFLEYVNISPEPHGLFGGRNSYQQFLRVQPQFTMFNKNNAHETPKWFVPNQLKNNATIFIGQTI